MYIRKFFVTVTICSLLFTLCSSAIQAQTTPTPISTISVTPTPTTGSDVADENEVQNKIKELEGKLAEAQAQGKTLSSQIAVMDSQIKLTQLRINATQTQLTTLNKDITITTTKIETLEGSLENITKVLLNRIVETYQRGTVPPLEAIVAGNNAKDIVTRANYLKIAQEHDKKLIYDTQQAKNDYQNQKTIFEEKKKKVIALQTQLQSYTDQLNNQKEGKKRLLADTQGSEASYQRLLSQARAQLAGFSRFTQNQGGASLLSGQTQCDSWGCYYNQRDSQWGAQPLNGTQYTLASDGCLVTSMAMVYTFMGHRNVTPATINSSSGNFASYYPAFLLKRISADGMTTDRVRTTLDSELSAGRPVIVGISYDSGPMSDHFLVIISGSNGNYMMNDPFTPNGRNIPFTSKYSVNSIRDIEKVVQL